MRKSLHKAKNAILCAQVDVNLSHLFRLRHSVSAEPTTDLDTDRVRCVATQSCQSGLYVGAAGRPLRQASLGLGLSFVIPTGCCCLRAVLAVALRHWLGSVPAPPPGTSQCGWCRPGAPEAATPRARTAHTSESERRERRGATSGQTRSVALQTVRCTDGQQAPNATEKLAVDREIHGSDSSMA